MSWYSIKDLERISTQKAHTIRIWEQRYGLLVPERTDTNIRYYSDEQLKKLLNVCALIGRGMKISHISKLSKSEIADEIEKIISGALQDDTYITGMINQSLIAIATYDEPLFNKLFTGAVSRLGLQDTYIKIIYPLLVRTGLMWTKDELLPAQEHFLSNLIRQKLFSAIDGLPANGNPDQTWVLFLNEHEDHEIGLLFANYLLRQNGKKVIYLGARVPYQDLSNVVQNCRPTHIYSFFVRNQLQNEMEDLLTNLTTDFSNTTICISGGDERIRKLAAREQVCQITTIESLLEIINSQHVSEN